MTISKVNNIAYSSLAKCKGVAVADLGKMKGVSKPSSGGKALDLASARNLQIVASNWSPNLDTDDFTDNGHLTFSWWFRSNSLTSYRPAWVYQAYNFHIQVEVRSSYVRFVHKTTSTGFRSAYVFISQAADTFYHYAVSLDPTNENMHCYVNGANKVTLNHADIGTVITPVGWQNAQNGGIVDEVAFFDGVLSDANIAKLYSDGGETPPDLSGLDFYGSAITYVNFDDLTFDNSGDSITGLKGKQTYSVSNNSNNTTLLTSTAAR